MRKAVLAGVAVVSLAGAAIAAPAGAQQDEAMQAGGWGPGGWQPGASASTMAQPTAMMQPAAIAPGMMDAAPMGPPPMHGEYRPVHPGQKLRGQWRDPALTVTDWREWGLGAPGPGMHWIRYYDDALVVDDHDRVVTARGGIPWDAPRHGWHHPPIGPGWRHPPIPQGTASYRAGPDTIVTTQVIAPPPIVYGGGYAPGYGYGAGYGFGGGYGGGYGYAGGGSTVIVSPGIVTTTTTTTTERVWRKVPVRGCRCARPTRSGKLVRR